MVSREVASPVVHRTERFISRFGFHQELLPAVIMYNAFLIVWVSVTLLLNAVHGTNLEDAVSELSAVARLLNGMAIQNDFVEHPENTKQVIAEMLNVPKASLLDDLNALNVKGLSTDLTAFNTIVKGMPALRTADVDEMNGGIQLLNDMRNSLDILKPGGVQDPTTNMATIFGNGETANFDIHLTASNFNETLERLTFLKDQTVANKHFMRLHLLSVKAPLSAVVLALKQCADYTNKFANFLKRTTAFDDLKTVRKFGSIAEAFFNNSNVYQTLSTKSVSAKEDVNDLSALQSSQQFGESVANIKKVSEILTGMMEDALQKTSTSGLPNGSKDIAKIAQDFKRSRLLKLMSGGKDWKKVEKNLGGVSKFGREMAQLEESWGKVAGRKDVRREFTDTVQILTSISAHVDKLAKISEVGSALGKVVNCVGKLTNQNTAVNFNDYKDWMNLISANGEGVKKFQNAVKTMLDGDKFSETLTDLEKWNQAVSPVQTNTPEDKAEEIYKKIKNASTLGRAIEIIKYAEQHILPLHTVDNIFIPILPNTYITDVTKSLDGTGLYETVECLKNENYDASLVSGILSLRADIGTVKNKLTDLDAVAQNLGQLGEVKKGYGKVQNVVGTSRSRREAKKGPFEMRNYQQTAQDVGIGVASLHSLTEIVKSEGDIAKVLNMGPAVHTAAEQSSGMWNEEARNVLKALPAELKALDKFAGGQKGKDVEKVWSVFGEAQKIKHADLNSKLLKDPIAADLKKTPATASAAPEFEKLSQLDLNFAQHQLHCKSAQISLIPLRDYFDSYFGNSKNGMAAGDIIVNNNGIDPMTIAMVVGGGAAAILVVVGLVFATRYLQKKQRNKKNWEKREHYWAYKHLKGTTPDAIFQCVRTGDALALKRMIEEGADLGRYSSSLTVLHSAVYYQQADLVEMLIKGGADRSLLNCFGETPEQMARSGECVDTDMVPFPVDAVKMKKCVEVFEKYAKMTFKPVPPLRPSWEAFQIMFSCDKKLEEEFKKKYDKLVLHDADMMYTQIVVDVDKDDVYDVDSYEAGKVDPYKLNLISFVFTGILLVKSKWAKLCLESEKNFYTDYEHRVMKVKYLGKVYDSVDEWRQWVLGRTIIFGHGMMIYFAHMDTEGEGLSEALQMIFMKHLTTLEEVKDESIVEDPFPGYWPHGKKQVVLVKPKLKAALNLLFTRLPEKTRDHCEVMEMEELFTWLLSFKGWKEMEEKILKEKLFLKKPKAEKSEKKENEKDKSSASKSKDASIPSAQSAPTGAPPAQSAPTGAPSAQSALHGAPPAQSALHGAPPAQPGAPPAQSVLSGAPQV